MIALRPAFRGLLCCLSLLTLGFPIWASRPHADLCGLVEGPEGSVEGAGIELRPTLTNYERTRRLLRGELRTEPVAVATTDATGRYCLDGPEPGVWRLVALARGFVPMRYFPHPAGEATDVELPAVHLLPDEGTRVQVSSTEREDYPAAVYALPGEVSPWAKPSRTGWHVASRLDRVEEGEEVVLPRASGERLDLFVHLRGSGRIERARDMEHARFVFQDRSERQVVIEVTTDGRPVPEAVVSIGDVGWPVGMTGFDGRLTLPGVRRNLVPLLILSKDGRELRHTVDLRDVEEGRTVVIELPAPRRIRGVVLTSSGTPLPGALVWHGFDPGRFVWSGADGEFELTASGEGRAWLQGHAPGHLPEIVRVPSAEEGGSRVELSLDRAVSVRGRAVGPGDDPVAGAEVTVKPTGSSPPLVFRRDKAFDRDRSGADGSFSLNVREGQGYVVEGRHAGFRPGRLVLGRDREARGEELVLRLERFQGAQGRVLSREGHPLEGVTVWLLPTAEQDRLSLETRARRRDLDPERAAESDENGLFTTQHLPGSKVDLVAHCEGFAPTVVPGIVTTGEGHPGGDRSSGVVDVGTIVLRRGLKLVGRVVDEEGETIPGASIWLLDPEESIGRQRATRTERRDPDARSGPDGGFRLADLPPATPVRLGVDAPRHRSSIVQLTEVIPEETIEVALEGEGLLRGAVVDPDGERVVGALVTVNPRISQPGVVARRHGSGVDRSVQTDDAGAFEIDRLEPGEYRVGAFYDGYLESVERTVEAASGVTIEGIELHLREGAMVEGWVRTEDGEPIEGAEVLVGRPAARTDLQGAFLIEGVEPGPTTIEVRHPEYVWHEEASEVEPGVNVFELELQQGTEARGVTVDADDRPLVGVSVRMFREERPSREYTTRSRGDGTFRFASVQPGTYEVDAEKRPLVQVDPEMRIVIGSDPVEDMVLRLRAGATVRGSIRGLELDEVSRVRIAASSEGRRSRRGTVDYSGRYTIESLAPGVWWIDASLHGGTARAEARVEIGEKTTEVARDLDMAAGFELRGIVVSGGEARAGVEMTLTGLDRSVSRRGRTDLAGRFEIRNLPEGEYRLTASAAGSSLVHNEVLRLSGDREITVYLESGGVRGAVMAEATSQPLPDALVVLGQLEGAGVEVSRVTVGTDSAGVFRIDELSAGRYRVHVRRDGYVAEEREVAVEPGEVVDLQVALQAAEGLRVGVQSAGGELPRWAFLRISEADGGRRMEEIRPIEEGAVEVPTVPAGAWNVVLAAPGSIPVEFQATVPGPTISVNLPPAGKLVLRAPALDQSGVTGTVHILGPGGQAVPGLDPETGLLRSRWPWRRDGLVIDGIPAGQWIVQIEASDGTALSGSVVTRGAGEEVVVLR